MMEITIPHPVSPSRAHQLKGMSSPLEEGPYKAATSIDSSDAVNPSTRGLMAID